MQAFLIRAVAGLLFAFVIMRFFYPEAGIERTLALAVLLVGLAYIKEAFGFRKKDKKDGQP